MSNLGGRQHLAAALAVVALTSASTHAAAGIPSAPAAAEHPAEVAIADTHRIAFVSKVNGRAYQIDIALPQVPPPSGGYPVIYVLDGNWYFASMTEAVRRNAPKAIVVGVGYPLQNPIWAPRILSTFKNLSADYNQEAWAINFARLYDLSVPADDAELKKQGYALSKDQPYTREDIGGVDDFLKTIEVEVKPRVYALADATHLQVNRGDQTLFGHSLGGLAAVEALFTEPQAFRTFVAASPSINWVDRKVLQKADAFEAQVKSGKITPRILFTVGANEPGQMVGDACELAGRLKAVRGAAGYEVADCAVFAGQEHGLAPWPAIGRAVSFAFPE